MRMIVINYWVSGIERLVTFVIPKLLREVERIYYKEFTIYQNYNIGYKIKQVFNITNDNYKSYT